MHTRRLFAVILVSVVLFFVLSSHVPLSMDEFLQYHILATRYYPLNSLNAFNENLGAYYLAPLPNLYLPLRSYSYVGAVHDLLYYPLFKVWPSPYSARLLGLIMLMIQAYCIHKLFKLDTAVVYVFLLSCMPYAFQHLVDTGPVSFQLTSIYGICYCLMRWMHAIKSGHRYSWVYSMAIGVTLFLGLWAKLTYLLLVPGLALLALYCIAANKAAFTKKSVSGALLRDGLLLCAVAAALSFMLLYAKDADGIHRYYNVLGTGRVLAVGSTAWLEKIRLLASYFGNPLKSAHRVFVIEGGVTFKGVLVCSVVSAFICLGLWRLKRKKERVGFAVLNVCLFFLVLLLMSKKELSWAMHHVVLSYPFLLLALFFLFSKMRKSRSAWITLLLVGALNASFYFDLGTLKVQDANPPQMIAMNEFVNKEFSGSHVIVVIDWGVYYVKSLYGTKGQCVLFVFPLLNDAQVQGVKDVLRRTQRKAVFIGRVDSDSDLALIRSRFPGLVQLAVPFEAGKWRIWRQQ